MQLQSSLTIQDNVQKLVTQQVELIAELRGQREQLEAEMARAEADKGEQVQTSGKQEAGSVTEDLAKQVASNLKPNPQGSPVAVTLSSSNPFRKESRPGFPNIQSSHGNFSVTTIDGNQVITDASHHATNTNSGNTTTTTITGSDNDSSVKIYGGMSYSTGVRGIYSEFQRLPAGRRAKRGYV